MLTLSPHSEPDSYRAGYTAAATEISRVLGSVGTVDLTTRSRLMSHLGHKLALPPPLPHYQLKVEGGEQDQGYNSGRDSTPSPSPCQETVWRPF